MTQRGDVVIVDFPYSDGGGKVRPVVVVQNDVDNRRLRKTVIAMITGNLRRAAEPTHLLIDPRTVEGAASGLNGPSLATCVNLYTVEQSDVRRTIGHLSDVLKRQLDNCLKAALDLP